MTICSKNLGLKAPLATPMTLSRLRAAPLVMLH